MRPAYRLRRHGRLTNQMEKTATEALDLLLESGGLQTSSNVVGTWVRLIQEAKGVKLARGERVSWLQEEGKPELSDWMLEVVVDGRTQLMSLVTYTKLFNYACFRPRTAELVAALRTRAVQLHKELDYPENLGALVLPGTVAMAMHVLPHESRSWDAMGGEVGFRSSRASGWVAARTVPETHVRTGLRVASWVDRMCVAIAGGTTTRGRVLPRAVA
uniref:Uncharacterized protein n=1 Tax=Grapevine-associated tombus-like virus 4 TaxID=2814344 RepID=A0A8F5RC16_9TOMB|nr:MAG: hypothetical protein [Grapevine-associated tombus-like virus 4]